MGCWRSKIQSETREETREIPSSSREETREETRSHLGKITRVRKSRNLRVACHPYRPDDDLHMPTM